LSCLCNLERNFNVPNQLSRRLLAYFGRLRFPQLTGLVIVLFVIDLLLPDPLPFVDELLLVLASLALSRWRAGPGDDDVSYDCSSGTTPGPRLHAQPRPGKPLMSGTSQCMAVTRY